MNALVALLALFTERLAGYPAPLQSRIGHPVQWAGALIDGLDKRLNLATRTGAERRRAGLFTLLVLVGITLLLTLPVTVLLRTLPWGWVAEAVLASFLLAPTQLGRMVADVAAGLETALDDGRAAVSHIVGRDTAALDEAEVSRAAIETLAENASDGVVAPLFWLLLFGLPGIAVYKAINTADSMIGHRTARHADFGRASAQTDDVANWIPARLTALLFALAAVFVPGANPKTAWRAARCDAPHHQSPNAGWPEAAMAGALGFGLGGPRTYRGQMLDLPHMGAGRRDLGAKDIRRALALYRVALVVMGLCVAALALACALVI